MYIVSFFSYMFSFLHKLLIDIKHIQYTSVSIYDINNAKAAGFHVFPLSGNVLASFICLIIIKSLSFCHVHVYSGIKSWEL